MVFLRSWTGAGLQAKQKETVPWETHGSQEVGDSRVTHVLRTMGCSMMSMRGRIGLGKGWVRFPPAGKEEKKKAKTRREDLGRRGKLRSSQR